jgi:hypothetical protein
MHSASIPLASDNGLRNLWVANWWSLQNSRSNPRLVVTRCLTTIGHMKSLLLLIVHSLVLIVKALRPGGVKSITAENVLLRHQLAVLSRSRQKAPNLRTNDCFLLGAVSLLVSPKRLFAVAIIIKPATLLKFHGALVKRKYRRLFINQHSQGGQFYLAVLDAKRVSFKLLLTQVRAMFTNYRWMVLPVRRFARTPVYFRPGIFRAVSHFLSSCPSLAPDNASRDSLSA